MLITIKDHCSIFIKRFLTSLLTLLILGCYNYLYNLLLDNLKPESFSPLLKKKKKRQQPILAGKLQEISI